MMTPNEIKQAVMAGEMTLADGLDAIDQWKAAGEWVPANGGTEEPFTARSGRRLLYVFQPRSGRHAYLDLGTDLVLDDADAAFALAA